MTTKDFQKKSPLSLNFSFQVKLTHNEMNEFFFSMNSKKNQMKTLVSHRKKMSLSISFSNAIKTLIQLKIQNLLINLVMAMKMTWKNYQCLVIVLT